MQLFETGLFLASFTSPKTAFTFAVLDDFLLDNLEFPVSAVDILQCIAHNGQKDRYRELMRVGRQWRQLKQLKWHGFGHEKRQPKAGELALFCPACPQPGVNVNLAEKKAADPAWLYSRSLVMDGNFKAEHMFPANPTDEVALTDGLGFMVSNAWYKMHLAEAKDVVNWSDCNNHQAVNQANASHHKLEATGIEGGKRVDESPYLDLPWGMEIIPGIGLWHVHSHRDKCYVQYASNFITSAARIDGEIMETLWAPLNIISPSARRMSTPHRKECLDFQMNDCNFMKMICISKFLCRKFKEGVQGVRDSLYAFNRLTPTRKQQELHLLKCQARWPAGEIHHGAETWLASGITLEEAQVALLIDVKKLGKRPTDAQKLAVARRRDRLQGQIDEFIRVAVTFLGDQLDGYDQLDLMTGMLDAAELDSAGSSSDDPDRADDDDRYDMPVEFKPETVVILLPSNIGIERCAEWGVADLVLQEISLREGQANDALHAIRVNLADKAVLFRTTVRSAKSQARSTRA
ncbi:hypothetical protein EV702DRAFT_1046372 [Suillus placidus]|uniref:CxC2-like cysteine cluster KDZ transposase-associated domain-containing protein n=1 Tax=Suillus placidus TaxID=48579 RepID=A0A9P7D112_9AGAM|nr:hypothetical protein EV702DRAFT_1046372 [Suillus placidus]